MVQIIIDPTKNVTHLEISQNCEILGIFFGQKDASIVSNMNIVHTKPNIESICKIKAVLSDNANLEVNYNLFINKGMKKTKSRIQLDAYILSNTASAKITPSLEISECEVEASHACAVSQPEPIITSYLYSRGLNHNDAIKLQTHGFLLELINQIKDVKIKMFYIKLLENFHV